MPESAKLIYGDRQIELPVIEGSEGERGIDITRLRDTTGLIAFDPGFANTGSCKSEITFIDGEKGILRYRGIPIEQFDRPSPEFLEVAWLLMFGHLPNKPELKRFRKNLTRNAHLDESMKHNFDGFPVTAHPMAMLSAMINALSCFHPELFRLQDDEAIEEAAAKLMSKIRTIAAFSYRRANGLPYMYPNPKIRYCANFLHMMFSQPYDEFEADKDVEDAMNLIFILHADHEQNCSTSTVRMVGSSQANLFASVAAGICALWGPLHGGANQAVIDMLRDIHKGNVSPEDCISLAKQKQGGFRLMGFGHRVYKNYDPRAKILKQVCDRVLTRHGVKDPLLDIARKLEELALADPYFVDRHLYPNVDFYSGIILRALQIPENMFPVIFAIGRLPGWIAHWREHYNELSARICRPRQIYTGPTQNDYVPLEER